MPLAPEEIETARLLLRRPRTSDADAIFSRYASDAEVTRYLSWPRHESVRETRIFVGFSEAEWERWGCGPYLIIDKAKCRRPKAESVETEAEGRRPKVESVETEPEGQRPKAENERPNDIEDVMKVPRAALLGSTGLAFETPTRAMTGYVLAKDAWGKGYATEALKAMVDLARALGVTYLFALCHAEHEPSWRVLEKGGLTREPRLVQYEFPNLAPGRFDTVRYSINL